MVPIADVVAFAEGPQDNAALVAVEGANLRCRAHRHAGTSMIMDRDRGYLIAEVSIDEAEESFEQPDLVLGSP
jgi:hypothetical protein